MVLRLPLLLPIVIIVVGSGQELAGRVAYSKGGAIERFFLFFSCIGIRLSPSIASFVVHFNATHVILCMSC